MNPTPLVASLMIAAGSLLAAESSPKDNVDAAVKALAAESNYSWKTEVVVPPDARFRPGPTEGKTEKDGFTHVTVTFFDNPVQIVRKGDKGAFLNQEGEWQTAAEAENEDGPGRFMAWFVRNLQTPAKQAAELASFAVELKPEDEAYSSALTESGVKTLLSFRRDSADPNISNPEGSVKFWVKEGRVSKYEFKVKGAVDWNGNTMDIDRATTVEIKDVGKTKVEVPAAAKQRLTAASQ